MDDAAIRQMTKAARKRRAAPQETGTSVAEAVPAVPVVDVPQEEAPPPAPKWRKSSGKRSVAFQESAGAGASAANPTDDDSWEAVKEAIEGLVRPATEGSAVQEGPLLKRAREAVLTLLGACKSVGDTSQQLKDSEARRQRAEASLGKAGEERRRLSREVGELKEQLAESRQVAETALAEVRQVREEMATAGRAAVEAYKASEECRQAKIIFATPAYDRGLTDAERRMKKKYPGLDTDCMFELTEEEGATDVLEPRDAVEPGMEAESGAPTP